MESSQQNGENGRGSPSAPPIGGPYRWYALGILVLCYLFNYVDRHILSILAEEVKRDIGLDDAQIGFLYGTAFAVFYAVFGAPFGRLADSWVRKNLIAIGLFIWSGMTALTGFARSFATLATFRVGVGVGEASLTPCAYSLLVDYFPPRLRATALALYSSGIYFGAGIGFVLGGWIIDTWNGAFPDGNAPLGLRAWQAAFLIVGLPGLLMSLWVWTLREPVRGQQEGIVAPPKTKPQPFREFSAVVPPLTMLSLWQVGAGGRGLLINLAGAAALLLAAAGMTAWTGNPAQWFALAVGLYAAFSWAHGLSIRDPSTFRQILGSRAFMYSSVGFASISFVTNGIAFWSAPFFLRVHEVTPTRVGALLGLGAAGGGWLGVTAGGLLSDWLKRKRPTGRVDMGILTVLVSAPALYLMLTVESTNVAFFFFFVVVAVVSLWIGPAAASANELVLPNMRSTASALYLLLNTFIGFALGPFAVGKISDTLAAGGASNADSLRYGIMSSMFFWVVTLFFLWRARPLVEAAEERARNPSAAAAAAEEVAR